MNATRSMNARSSAARRYHRAALFVAVLSLAGIATVLALDPEHAAAAPAPVATELDGTSEEQSEAPEPAPEDTSDGADSAAGEKEQEPTAEDESAGGGEKAITRAGRKNKQLRITSAYATPKKIFLGGRKTAKFRFQLRGNASRKLLVKIVHVKTGNVVKRKRIGWTDPGELTKVTWQGKLRKGFTKRGKHAFRVFAGGKRAKVSKDSGSQRFRFYEHRFPLLGRHDYGDGFGAGRGHQGQDIFARCGNRIVAARGGRVQTKAYQSSAGYYVVIDGRGTGQDYAYMHMEKGGRPKQGSWVKTGQTVGRNSDTGSATGCHLHFEIWSAPGWYEGGSPKAPTRSLKRWDSWS